MKLVAPIALIVLGLIGLIVMGIVQGGIPEMQVADLLVGEKPEGVVKVHGLLEKIHSSERPLRFTVSDKEDPTQTFDVYCDRTRPDTFQETYDVAVQGRWNAESGRFEADQIFTKCPSKYEAEDKLGLGRAPVVEAPAKMPK